MGKAGRISIIGAFRGECSDSADRRRSTRAELRSTRHFCVSENAEMNILSLCLSVGRPFISDSTEYPTFDRVLVPVESWHLSFAFILH